MDVISNNGWEDSFCDLKGPADEVFLKRLEVVFKIIEPGVFERVPSADLWAIVRATVRAYVPRVDDVESTEKEKILYYQGSPITPDKKDMIENIFKFKQWLRRHISENEERELRRTFSTSAQKVDDILSIAFKTNTPENIKTAVAIWEKILSLGEKELTNV